MLKKFYHLTFFSIILFVTYPSYLLAKFNFSRSNIHIVGSSTVYPFIADFSEDFGRMQKITNKFAKTPIVEANGTGGGFKLFCGGVGLEFPDIINASRKIENSEINYCKKNKINRPLEVKIGYDGIVLANKISGQDYQLNLNHLFLALISHLPNKNGNIIANPFTNWSQIDQNLPNVAIKIYGPPSSSGTRDSFVDLAIEKQCLNNISFISAYPDEKIRKQKCKIIRSDGHFIEAGENDNLIIQKLQNDQNAIGIFGFNFLQENSTIIKPVKVNNILPTIQNIADGSYVISRPLFIYVKLENLPYVQNLKLFVESLVDQSILGDSGYLVKKGLVPLKKQELEIEKIKISTHLK